jgi:hypothetical protein
MRRNRPVMNALRGQIRMLEGNPGLPGGVLPPSVAWLEANCTITQHDYGNGNVQYNYVCEHVGSGNRLYRCTWSRWSNSNAVQLVNCVEITRAHYHDVHGGGEGPQSYGTPQMPPYVPGQAPTEAQVGASSDGPGAYHYGRWNPISFPQKIRDAISHRPAHELAHLTTRHAGNPDEPPPRLVYGHTQTRLTLRERLARFFRI